MPKVKYRLETVGLPGRQIDPKTMDGPWVVWIRWQAYIGFNQRCFDKDYLETIVCKDEEGANKVYKKWHDKYSRELIKLKTGEHRT